MALTHQSSRGHAAHVERIEQHEHVVQTGGQVVPAVTATFDVGHTPAQLFKRVAQLIGRVPVAPSG